MTARRPIPAHGTASRYRGDQRNNRWQPCRCEPCRTASRRRRKTVELRVARGGTGRYEAGPVAAHIRRLFDAGWTQRQIADVAQVDRKTLFNAINQTYTTVNHQTARRILQLVPEYAGCQVNPTGAARRLQALAAIGWSLEWTCGQAGITTTAARYILGGGQKWVHRTTHEAIDRVYRTHCAIPGPSNWVRSHAARKGWVSPAAWDNIDDPAAQPEAPSPERELNKMELGRHRRQEIEHLASFGVAEHEIADRLGMARAYVHDILRELRKERLGKPAATVISDLEVAA
ncbi:hypothetical protein [Streptomyces nigrescens]